MCQIQVEQVKNIFTDLKSYNENFKYRERLIDISMAMKIMIYPKYMIVNKTNHDLLY